MNQISPQQYEQVLNYMQTANEDNFDHALLTLQQHHFNFEQAINSKFNAQPAPPPPRNQGPSDQEVVQKYIDFVRRKNAEWTLLGSIFWVVKTLLLLIVSILMQLSTQKISIVPQTIRIRYFGSDFQKLYRGKMPQNFSSQSLSSLLAQTRNNSSKVILLLISPSKQNRDIEKCLTKLGGQSSLSRNFLLTGYNIGHAHLNRVQNKDAPLLVALRQNLFEELVEIGRTDKLTDLDQELLRRWAHEGRNLFKRDCNVLVKYRNFVHRAFGNFLQEDEEEEVNFIEHQRSSQEIQQQNMAYQRLEEETLKQKQKQEEEISKEQEQQSKKEQLLAERQARRESIPQEPTEGDLVRLSFRCPDGSTILRNFHASQKLDIVFQWVEVNEEIVFEDEKREFQLLHSYPPAPLSGRKQETLGVVFDGPQQKLVIREL